MYHKSSQIRFLSWLACFVTGFIKISSLDAEERTVTGKLRLWQNFKVPFTYLMIPIFYGNIFFHFLGRFPPKLEMFFSALSLALKVPENSLDSSPQVASLQSQSLMGLQHLAAVGKSHKLSNALILC